MPYFYCRRVSKEMYYNYNPNPAGSLVGDCVIRAIAKVTNQDWEETYLDVCLQGFAMRDMPSANHVWSAYLIDKGFIRGIIPNTCPDCYTVSQFCMDNPEGTFLLATGSHVVAVQDGDYYDAWDSGEEVPIYYFYKEEN